MGDTQFPKALFQIGGNRGRLLEYSGKINFRIVEIFVWKRLLFLEESEGYNITTGI